jgi:hypothetical protein
MDKTRLDQPQPDEAVLGGPRLEVNAPTVISEVIDGEAVIMNMATGRYFSCQEVGGEVWSMIEDGAALGSIRQRLLSRYAVDASILEQSLTEFLASLREHDLIREIPPGVGNGGPTNSGTVVAATSEPGGPTRSGGVAATSPGGAGGKAEPEPRSPEGTAFNPPVLSVYSDMEDLLLLDPIHDVDETGWPQPRSDEAAEEE